MLSYKILDLRCPGCGEPSSTTEKNCKYCGREIIFTSFSSVLNMSQQDAGKYINSYKEVLKEHPEDSSINFSIGMCYLKLKIYEKAQESFEMAMQYNLDNSENYFYAAVSLLKGKKAYVTPKVTVDKSLEYLSAAKMIDNRGVYSYFAAYLKYDFYERKFLQISPDYKNELNNACLNNISTEDIQTLFDLLNVEIPAVLVIN